MIIASNANLYAELRAEMHSLRTEVGNDFRSLESWLAVVERRQARTEGLLESLRDAIVAQRESRTQLRAA